MSTYQEAVEQAYKQRQVADMRRASKLGLNTSEYRLRHKQAIDSWTEIIRELMAQNAAHDPVEILPELCAHLVEEVAGIAEAKAELAARSVVQRMLKKAMVG
jgi:hypothetical protein